MTSKLIAIARLVLLIPLIWLLTDGGALHYWGALVVFLGISGAGLFDEYILSRNRTPVGAMLHVLGDRLLVVVVVAGLIAAGMREGLVLLASLVLIARNSVIATINEALPNRLDPPMSGLEKGRLGLQMIGFGFLIPPNFPLPETLVPSHVLGGVALILAAVVSVISLAGHARNAAVAFKAAR